MSAQKEILKYLEKNTGVFPSGELQRMEWKNDDGTIAVPRTIVRRLQELARDGKIQTTEINGHAHYSFNEIPKPQKKQYVIKDPLSGELLTVY